MIIYLYRKPKLIYYNYLLIIIILLLLIIIIIRVTEVVFGHVSEYGFCGLHECSNSENIFMDLKLGSWLQHGTRKEDLVISLFSKNR